MPGARGQAGELLSTGKGIVTAWASKSVRDKEETIVALADPEAYCVKCKTKRAMSDAKEITMKNGRPALQGKCPVCGTTLNRILAAK